MRITVTSEVIAGLLAEARDAHPREACGLLYGAIDRVNAYAPAANVHLRPDRFFEIDPAALIAAHRAMRGGGPRLVGYYHSHPSGPAAPSETDRAMAAADEMIWAIVAAGRVTLWRAGDDGLTPLRYRVTDG